MGTISLENNQINFIHDDFKEIISKISNEINVKLTAFDVMAISRVMELQNIRINIDEYNKKQIKRVKLIEKRLKFNIGEKEKKLLDLIPLMKLILLFIFLLQVVVYISKNPYPKE